MKKLAILFLLAVSGTLSYAQTIDFGLKGGLNLTEENHGSTYAYNQNFLAGFNAGGIIDISFKNFEIQPGLFFTTKGETGTYTFPPQVFFGPGPYNIATTESIKSRRDYIEIPLNFLYKTTPVHGTSIHFGGGPYVAYCVSETDVVDGQASSGYNYRRTDAGLGAILGATVFSHYLIDAGFEYGLINLNQQEGTHNVAMSISGGYLFK
jgi:hypothetical protein